MKEYSLGAEVFGRGDAFDPRMDPIVRVQARNLRARLAQYYAGPGANDPVVIDLPKRTYVPVFRPPSAETVPETPAEAPAAAAPPVTGVPDVVKPVPADPPRAESTSPAVRIAQAKPGEPVVVSRRLLRAFTSGLVLAVTAGVFWWQTRPEASGDRTRDPDLQSQQAYIRGRYLMDRQTEQGIRAGIACFEEAAARDPIFAATYAGLADGYNLLAQYGYIPPSEGMEKARKFAEQALDIDPGLAEGHVSLAAVLEAYDWNWSGAEREYKRALGLNPHLPAAHLWYGMFLRDQGRIAEALPKLRRAAQLDPTSVITSLNLAHGLMVAGNAAGAKEQALHTAEMAPGLVTAHVLLANAHRAQSQTAEAEAALDRARPYTEDNPHGMAMLARAYVKYGKKEESRRLFRELEQMAARRYVSPFDLGTVSLALGDEDRALALLQEAFKQRSSGLIFLRDASFSRMLRAPEFHSLIEKMRFAG